MTALVDGQVVAWNRVPAKGIRGFSEVDLFEISKGDNHPVLRMKKGGVTVDVVLAGMVGFWADGGDSFEGSFGAPYQIGFDFDPTNDTVSVKVWVAVSGLTKVVEPDARGTSEVAKGIPLANFAPFITKKTA